MEFYSLEKLREMPSGTAQNYCHTLREFLVETVQETGGHLASNLGVVEISTALLRVFDPKKDKIIYDTGHQCYIHKILTGRGEKMNTLRTLDGISGFPNRKESPYDAFGTGHSGTGLSAALGFAKACRLNKEEDFAVCVIGDGSFSGGMVMEGINNIAPEDRVIIILNDNQMSISKSVGTLRGTFQKMRTQKYYLFKSKVRRAILPLPGGNKLARAAKRIKDAVKRVTIPQGNLFEQYGLNYFGPADGNNLEEVEFLLKEAKKKDRPSIIHLCTQKGKGYAAAEENPSYFHGVSPKSAKKEMGPGFSQLFGNTLSRLAREDDAIVAVTAAMTDGVGLSHFAKEFPHRLFDVGIAEEHAMTFCAALCAAGKKPCFAVYSTFFQRSIDQFLHDAALQNLPVVVCLDRAGISGEDGCTHHGLFDLSLTLSVPGVKIYAPCTEKELESALKTAFQEESCPSLIRYPKGGENPLVKKAFPCEKAIEEIRFGKTEPSLTVITFGRTSENALEAAKIWEEEGISSRVIRFSVLKGFPEEDLLPLFSGKENLLFVEEGMKIGGFSSFLLARLAEKDLLRASNIRFLAIDEDFVPHGDTSSLMRRFHLDTDSIVKAGRSFDQT